jgi:S-formylglutathione hydrolase FrmB
MKQGVFVAFLWLQLAAPSFAASPPQVVDVAYPSAALTKFLGRPLSIHANVLLPDSYYKDPGHRYPVIYVIPAFDGGYTFDSIAQSRWRRPMTALHRDFIVVMLEGMVAINGERLHHVFADSANDGPWGTALTTEFVPAIDQQFQTVAAPQSRFLFGHSSGGWSALWLQVNYPDLFGGAWALSPDPVDFHDFVGPDLTKNPPQNFYQDDSGNQYETNRIGFRDRTTLYEYLRQNYWMYRQIDSFNEVFSPRAPDGSPATLFNVKTGTIDRATAAYWEDHYDITHLIELRWSEIGPKLNGKLHVYVGDADTFHLDGAVRLLKAALARLGANEEIEFAPGADHWAIYRWHGDIVKYAMSEMSSAATSAP